jgi:hypothetical protein
MQYILVCGPITLANAQIAFYLALPKNKGLQNNNATTYASLLLFCGNVELKVEDVAILNDISLALLSILPSVLYSCHRRFPATQLLEVFEGDSFCLDKPSFLWKVLG